MRTIQIANTKTQRRYSIETEATTLGELQDEMTRMGIDFTGMTFTEGISKTQLLGRESLLPTNVMYKGQPTNNLVMLLTNTTKQISSGAYDRKELYSRIKAYGLENTVKIKFGKNYTMVSNDNLAAVLDNVVVGSNAKKEAVKKVREELKEIKQEESKTKLPDVKTAPHAATVEWFYAGIKAQVKDNTLFPDDIIVLANLLEEYALRLQEEQPKISDEDIDDIINSI